MVNIEMAGFRIVPSASPAPTPKAKAQKNCKYLDFIRSLPCIVTGASQGIEAAHLSFASTKHGHYGRGRGTKAPDRWALPLHTYQHRRQHSMNEQEFWHATGIDPHLTALAIFGLWSDLGDDAQGFAQSIIFAGLAAAGRLNDRSTL